MAHGERLIDGVCHGGGATGLAYLGALEAFESAGYWFRRVAGSSSGSVIAALIACGYRARPTSACSLQVIRTLDHRTFLDGGWLGAPRRLLREGGLFLGRRMTETFDALFKQGLGLSPGPPSPTFKDLGTIELYLVASNLTSREILVLSRETTPDLPIAEAVRMSFSLPFIYVPRRWRPSPAYATVLRTIRPQLVVDGGVLSSFPMFVFKDPPTYLPASEEDRGRAKLGFILVQGEEPGLDAGERQRRKRRARPARPWWVTGLAWLGIATTLSAYAFVLSRWTIESPFWPLWEAEVDAYFYTSYLVRPWPEPLRRLIYTLVNVLFVLPKVVVGYLPIILGLLVASRCGRLLRALAGLTTVGFDQRHMRSADVVQIFVGPYPLWRFRLSDDQRDDIIARGANAVRRFLPVWESRQRLAAGRD